MRTAIVINKKYYTKQRKIWNTLGSKNVLKKGNIR